MPSSKLTFADRAACQAFPYGWSISGPVGAELAVRHFNGTTQQVIVVNDADLIAKVGHFENWRADVGKPAN